MSSEHDPEPLVRPIGGSDTPRDEGSASAPPPSSARATPPVETTRPGPSANMLPQRERRPLPERMLVRVIATCGIVAIGVVIGAILTSSNVHGWIVGLVVSAVSVVLAAVLWSSRVL